MTACSKVEMERLHASRRKGNGCIQEAEERTAATALVQFMNRAPSYKAGIFTIFTKK
jgi:hypothetical protein